jgi:hypothetical protein
VRVSDRSHALHDPAGARPDLATRCSSFTLANPRKRFGDLQHSWWSFRRAVGSLFCQRLAHVIIMNQLGLTRTRRLLELSGTHAHILAHHSFRASVRTCDSHLQPHPALPVILNSVRCSKTPARFAENLFARHVSRMNWLFQPLLLLLARSTDNELAKMVEFLKAENDSCADTFQSGSIGTRKRSDCW